MITKTVPSWCEKKNKVLSPSLSTLRCAVSGPRPRSIADVVGKYLMTQKIVQRPTGIVAPIQSVWPSHKVSATFVMKLSAGCESQQGLECGVYLKWHDKTQLWYQVIALYTFVVTVSEYFALVTHNGMATTNDKEKLVFYLKCWKHFAEILIKHLAVNCLISSIL